MSPKPRLQRMAAICTIALLSFLLCPPGEAQTREQIMVFHAGSLAVPFAEMARAFEAKPPGTEVLREAAGSRTCARKITDLRKPCDVMASADYTVIEELLFPEHARWNLSFATNEMAIMHRPDSRYADEISAENWYEILLREDVEYGHSDPNSDPCGYRSQLVWQLAELYYEKPGLYEDLKAHCPRKNIRPKETDLIAMLEVGQIDYVFIYRSVCRQHGMPYVELPDEVNLGSSRHEAFYRKARIEITGKRPGETISKTGKPMVYGMTIPVGARNPEGAVRFVAFVLGPEGRRIMEKNGQPPIHPPEATGRVDLLPLPLKNLVR